MHAAVSGSSGRRVRVGFSGAAAVLIAVGGLLLGYDLNRRQTEAAGQTVQEVADSVAAQLRERLHVHATALQRMTKRWRLDTVAGAAFARDDAELYVEQQNEAVAIERYDAATRSGWSTWPDGSIDTAAAEAAMRQAPEDGQAFLTAGRGEGDPVDGLRVNLATGGTGTPGAAVGGTMLSIAVAYAPLFDRLLEEMRREGYRVTVTWDDRRIAEPGGAAPPDTAELERTAAADFAGQRFAVMVGPTAALAAELRSRLPMVVAAIGVLIGGLVGVIGRLANKAALQAGELVEVNAQLVHRAEELDAQRSVAMSLKADAEAARELAERAEMDMRRLQERLEFAVRGTSDGLWDWTVGTEPMWMAPTFRGLLGFDPDDETAMPNERAAWMRRVHPDDAAAVEEAVERHLMDRTPCRVDHRLRLRNGTFRWFRLRGSAVWDEDGRPVRMAGSIQDVTDERAALTTLRRSNEELQQFAYVASHDLQEPLRMIASYLDLLRHDYGDRLDAEASQYIGFAVDGAVRMKALIGDLLTYSRVESRGRRPEPVDTDQSLGYVLHDLSAAIAEAEAEVTHDRLPVVAADPTQIEMLLRNLVGNAVKFRRPGVPPRVHVGVIDRPDCFEFSVQDNGIGIDQRFVDRIFVIFQRLHARHEYEGTGIGLAVCRKIVERHGGRIWVESEPGNGSAFRFTIPKSIPQGDDYDTSETDRDPAGRGQPGRREADRHGVGAGAGE